MKSFLFFPAVVLIGCLVFSSGTYAITDGNASVVLLRYDDPNKSDDGCTEAGLPLNNCFTDLESLNSWIGTRAPSAASPLLVEIGPGTFIGNFRCVNKGYITLRGAGKQNTTIGPGNNDISAAGMFLKNCTNLDVSNLKVVGDYGAIVWSGTGTTKWTDVEVVGKGIGWYETGNLACSQQQTKHYWFSSHIEAQTHLGNVYAYTAGCGESWFFGSELVSSATTGWNVAYPIWATSGAEAHIYGSVLRTIITSAGVTTTSSAAAAYAQGGQIHIHGTGIDVISQAAVPIAALKADSGGMIHANGAAYNLSTGTGGTVTRIVNNGGHIHAPYLWEHIPDPATIPNFTSVNGADMTTVTTGTSDGQPHLVIYSDTCTSKWYDATDKQCRH